MEDLMVLIQSDTGCFSGFLAKHFWSDPYQLPIAVGSYAYEKEAVERFMKTIIDSDCGYRHGSTRIEKVTNLECSNDINACIEQAKNITGSAPTFIYIYQKYQWYEGCSIEEELKFHSLTVFYVVVKLNWPRFCVQANIFFQLH